MHSGPFDRSPLFCPAGTHEPRLWGVAETLREFPLKDKVDALIHGTGIYKDPMPKYPQPPLKTTRYSGIYTEIRDAISPPPPSAFQMFLDDLRETTYQSYWNQPVGKGRDPRPILPPGVNNSSRTFGKPPNRGEALYKIILPEKNQCQVLRESHAGHDLYRKTHSHYYPSERIDRNYDLPYHTKLTFGGERKLDPRGTGARLCLTWQGEDTEDTFSEEYNRFSLGPCEPVKDAKEIEKKLALVKNLKREEGQTVVKATSLIRGERIERYEYCIGKSLTPNFNYMNVPQCFTYGKPQSEIHSVANLLRDSPISQKALRMQECMAHINTLRRLIRRRTELLPYENIRDEMIFLDQEKTGWLPFPVLVEALVRYNLLFDHSCIIDFMRHGGYALPLCPEAEEDTGEDSKKKCADEDLQSDSKGDTKRACQKSEEDYSNMMVDYSKLIDIIDWRLYLPSLGKLEDSPQQSLHYKTSYEAANEDYKNDIHKDLPYAGMPSVRTDSEHPIRPPGSCLADIEHLGDETTAAAVICPSIMSQYGINHRDFFMPRTAEVIRGIFERTGVEFPDNNFDVIFKESAKVDCFPNEETCCVETFRNQLHKLAYEYYNATV